VRLTSNHQQFESQPKLKNFKAKKPKRKTSALAAAAAAVKIQKRLLYTREGYYV
jgi:hypothetical protein